MKQSKKNIILKTITVIAILVYFSSLLSCYPTFLINITLLVVSFTWIMLFVYINKNYFMDVDEEDYFYIEEEHKEENKKELKNNIIPFPTPV